MNLIEKQAEKFVMFKMNDNKPYQEFVGQVKFEINQYSQIPHKIQFLETVMFEAKKEYEEHLPTCQNLESCPQNIFYESVIFFLNEERQKLARDLTKEEFK